MDLIETLEICSFPSCVFILLVAILAVNEVQRPEGYSRVGGSDDTDEQSLSTLTATVIFISLFSASISLYLWIRSSGQVKIPIFWVLLIFASYRLNKPQNALVGGQISLFLVLFIFGASQGLSLAKDILTTSSTNAYRIVLYSLHLFLIWTLGSYSSRTSTDDANDVSCEKGASIFSLMTISWITKLIKKGAENPLTMDDVWKLIDADMAETVVKEYETVERTYKTLALDILTFNSKYLLLQYILAFFLTLLTFTSPLFIYLLVTAIQNGITRFDLCPYLLGLFACSILRAILDAIVLCTGPRLSTRARIVLVDQIYQKTLRRKHGSALALGNIVSLMSVDAEQLRKLCVQSFLVFLQMPLTIIISIYSLYIIIGNSAFVGLALVLVFMSITGLLGNRIVKYKKILLGLMDERVSSINEVLQGVRVIKYSSLEKHFISKIEKVRMQELKAVVHLWIIKLIFRVIGSASGILIAFVTLASYTLIFGNTLDPATAFTSMNLLMIISDFLGKVPNQFLLVWDSFVSLDRIKKYLSEPEMDKFNLDDANKIESNPEMIGFAGATFEYAESNFKLQNLNLLFEAGKLSLITGSTGSGKSSLLLALLGEMSCISGQYYFPRNEPLESANKSLGLTRSIAYACQQPWILNATIRENICFGNPFDPIRFEAVIIACALVVDLQKMKGGDLEEIGENGINLSGGQRQRVALARVCYSRASVVLLDHPLSAVDASTARLLLQKVVLGMLKGRTVIVCSHAVKLIAPHSDMVVRVENGGISFSGSFEEFSRLEKNEDGAVLASSSDEAKAVEEKFDLKKEGEGTILVKPERKATGSLDWVVYMAYLNAAGGAWFIIQFMIGFFVLSGVTLGNSWWLKIWSDSNSNAIFYIQIYALMGFLVIIAANAQSLIFVVGSYKASLKLHSDLLDRIMFAPLRYFDVTPSGRILNVFSKDFQTIDVIVMDAVQQFLASFLRALTVILVIGAITPIFLIAVPFISVMYAIIASYYLKTSRELKRFESINRSPLYAQFSETLMGCLTIRAFGAEERFVAMNRVKINSNHQPRVFWIFTNRWLSLRTDSMSSLIVLAAGLAVAFGDFSAGLAALTLSYALQMSSALLDAVRDQADLELTMNSCERVSEYLGIDQEAAYHIPDTKPLETWPDVGKIEVNDICIRYADNLPMILKNVSFTVKGNEKVAIVGRTGAGKTTLSAAFFRILPLMNGSIHIDGVDIATLGLHELRSKISIISQDAVLFKGTLRSNLDPANRFTDDVIWDALQRVGFIQSFQLSQTLNLEFSVQENGSNLSQGQKQLICLARAMISRKKIVLLDESTSSLDSKTDAHIQQVIRRDFKNSTVLCIAHRIQTVIDYDRVLVMDDGQVAEFGTPQELLNARGVFYSMCKETGEFKELMAQSVK